MKQMSSSSQRLAAYVAQYRAHNDELERGLANPSVTFQRIVGETRVSPVTFQARAGVSVREAIELKARGAGVNAAELAEMSFAEFAGRVGR